MNVSELYSELERWLPPSLSCEWDNDGMMCCCSPARQVSKVLITLDITRRAAKVAVDGGFDCIVSHHPLIFQPLRGITDPIFSLLIQQDIAALSFHTRLDAAPGGVNDALAGRLLLQDCIPFGEGGMGRIGTLAESCSATEFAAMAKKRLNAGALSFFDAGRPVRRVAVVGGSGGDFAEEALRAGADAFLTGSIGYNAMLALSEKKINILECGHYATEQPVCAVLAEKIQNIDASVQTELFESCPFSVI